MLIKNLKYISKSVFLACIFTTTLMSSIIAQDASTLAKLQAAQSLSSPQSLINQQRVQNNKNLPQPSQIQTQTQEPSLEKEELSPLEQEFHDRDATQLPSFKTLNATLLRPEIPTKNPAIKKHTFETSQPKQELENQTPPNPSQKNQETQTNIDPELKTKTPTENKKVPVIKQFGYDVFKIKRLDVAQNGGVIPVNNDYLLGPGDRLQIRIWGKIEQVIEAEVDAQGNIFVPKAGLIPVSGIRYGNINSVIKKVLENYYVNLELSVALTNLRTIKVFVLGYVKEPGAYDVSSLSTLFTALHAAGGPIKTGSLRKIQLKRNGRTYRTIDLYDYLLKGDNRQDPSLRAFDTIFVPAIGDVVQIKGLVKQPAIYEINSRISAFDAINELAGGFGTHSFDKKVQIERINEKSERELIDILSNSSTETRVKLRKQFVKNGDIITIDSMNFTVKNSIQIDGNVERKGYYAYKEKITVQEFLSNCGGIKEGSSPRIQIFRYVSEEQRELVIADISTSEGKNLELKPRDLVKVLTEAEAEGKEMITINGAVKKSGPYFLLKKMTISDILELAQLEYFADLSSAEIYRKNAEGKEEIIKLNLVEILSNKSSTQNIYLKNNDQISIRTDNKLSRIKKITLSGEFKYPGVYIALENETLSSIIERAGGYTPKAFLRGSIFHRESIKKFESDGNRLILEEEKKRLIYDQKKNDSLNREAESLYNSTLTFLQEKIDESIGRLVINLDDPNFKNSQFDIILEDGDLLEVPETPQSIQIVGGVQIPTSIVFQDGKSPTFYIQQAGGYSSYSKKGQYFVIKPNGSVLLKPSTIQRGDTIYVPEEIKIKTKWIENTNLVVQTIFTFLGSLKLLGVF